MKRSLSIVAAAALLVGLMISPVAAKPVGGGGGNTNNNGSCPSSTGAFLQAPNVGAESTGTDHRTYFFTSFVDENPVGGVPGLVGYCVYTNQAATSGSTSLPNWNWTLLKGKKSFVFARSGGNQNNNVPLDGTGPTTIGTATFAVSPTSEIILLHINDAAVCASLYGGLSPSTCWVLPSPTPPPPDPCASGDSNFAYSDLPTGVLNCYKPSEAFEAQGVGEFGQEVGLAGTARNLSTLEVLFSSYACSVSGHWNTGDCVTNSGDTFDWPITANIYDPSNLVNPIATVTQTFTIPYRPSADAGNCPGGGDGGGILDGSQWFNSAAPVGQQCIFSKSIVLTFSFAGETLPDDVVWAVAFNTSDYGLSPQAPQACNLLAVGCPYDSLNVGTKTYAGAPYAGTFANADEVFKNGAFEALWTGFAPLGRITTTP